MHTAHRSWDEAYEQLQYERGACNLVQKYTPQLVRQRVLYSPQDTLAVMVCAPRPHWLSHVATAAAVMYTTCASQAFGGRMIRYHCSESLVILGVCKAIKR